MSHHPSYSLMADSWPRPVANSGLPGLKWGLGSGLWETLGDSGMNARRDACGKVQMLGEEGKRRHRVQGGCFHMLTTLTKLWCMSRPGWCLGKTRGEGTGDPPAQRVSQEHRSGTARSSLCLHVLRAGSGCALISS